MNRYFSLVKNGETNEATLNIFGDITSYAWEDAGQISAYNLSKQLEEMQDVKKIHVHINSYGGEVAEGLAIYNSLRNHKAKVITYCDGFACSIASVIFMAGDVRVMSKASLLMIHNAWTFAQGNAEELRKQADDLEKITSASINAYLSRINISEEELKTLMDNETWLTYQECLDMGFATKIAKEESKGASQNVKQSLIEMILQSQQAKEIDVDDDEEIEEKEDEEEDTASTEEPEDDTDEESGDTEETEDDEEEQATQKIVAFFNAMIGGMKND